MRAVFIIRGVVKRTRVGGDSTSRGCGVTCADEEATVVESRKEGEAGKEEKYL